MNNFINIDSPEIISKVGKMKYASQKSRHYKLFGGNIFVILRAVKISCYITTDIDIDLSLSYWNVSYSSVCKHPWHQRLNDLTLVCLIIVPKK